MYSKYEKPIIRGTLYYYDSEYPAALGDRVREILEEYGFFPPEKLYADRLTGGHFRTYTPEMADFFPRGYAEKEVFSLSMASGDSRIVDDFWKFDWNFTFHKCETLAVTPKFTPWNVLHLDSTYGRLRDEQARADYMDCLTALIGLIRPFYARIDDVDNAVRLLKAPHFIPGEIQQIYWGNYFGPGHCEAYGMDNLLQLPAHASELADGVFFTLTDNMLDARAWKCHWIRGKVKRYLDL